MVLIPIYFTCISYEPIASLTCFYSLELDLGRNNTALSCGRQNKWIKCINFHGSHPLNPYLISRLDACYVELDTMTVFRNWQLNDHFLRPNIGLNLVFAKRIILSYPWQDGNNAVWKLPSIPYFHSCVHITISWKWWFTCFEKKISKEKRERQRLAF